MARQTKIFFIFALIVALILLPLMHENEEVISKFVDNYIFPVILILMLFLWVSDLLIPKKLIKKSRIKKTITKKSQKNLSFFQYLIFFPLLVFGIMMAVTVVSRLGQP